MTGGHEPIIVWELTKYGTIKSYWWDVYPLPHWTKRDYVSALSFCQ